MANDTLNQDGQKSIHGRIVKIDLIIAKLKDELQKLADAMLHDKKYQSNASSVAALIIEVDMLQKQLNYEEQRADDEQAQQNNPPFTIKRGDNDNT